MIGKTLAAAATLVGLTLGANWFLLDVPTAKILADDQRNHGIVMHAYAKWLINPRHLVLDIWSIQGENSKADVDRVIFQASASLNDYSFDAVTLAFRGRGRFMLPGDYFRQLGTEFEAGQNPIYLIRTLPENVNHTDGSDAFPQWTGGLLGVVNKQMEDHNAFHEQWYWNELVSDMTQ